MSDKVNLYSKSVRMTGGTVLTLREVDPAVLVVEVGQHIGGTYEPQRILVDVRSLYQIGEMIADYSEESRGIRTTPSP